MKPLKVFVGIDGRFVFCENFPNDEEHAGLNEMLFDLKLQDIEVQEPMGFYLMEFEIINDSLSYYIDGSYLDVKRVRKIL